MIGRIVKAVMLTCLLAIVVIAVQKIQSEVSQAPLKEWAYPKAEKGKEGTDQPPLIWAKFTTTDPFEKVLKFYLQKISPIGSPLERLLERSPKVKSVTVYSGRPPDVTISAYFYDDNPLGKLGVCVTRQPNKTISITIFQRAKEKRRPS